MKSLKIDDFNLRTSVECGQTFCWKPSGQGYINADIGQAVYVEQEQNTLYYETSDSSVDIERLLGLNDPLHKIHREIGRDSLTKKSIEYSYGLRIVSDPFFPCLVSFISSTRKNIPAIKKILNSLRRRYGTEYNLQDSRYFGMPTPNQLSVATIEDLKECGLGYRAEFIQRSTQAILSEEIQPQRIARMPYEKAHAALKEFHGVGNKVADCICLFSLGHLEAFPIDVWIERVIQQQSTIFEDVGNSYAKKSQAAREYYGRFAGYAQEYLYHYTRSTYQRGKFEESAACS